MIDELNAVEQKLVSRVAPKAKYSFWLVLAMAITRLGNFWLYPLIGFILLIYKGSASLSILIIGGANIFFLHRIYPWIKEKCARIRPIRPNIPGSPDFNQLDIYSFPSGHVMTLTGLVIPIMVAFPDTVWLGVAAIFTMAWARIACAHHYPTDVLGGVTLGFIVSYPFAVFLFAK
jgi:undecaprenyl-diphosphatase